VREWLNL